MLLSFLSDSVPAAPQTVAAVATASGSGSTSGTGFQTGTSAIVGVGIGLAQATSISIFTSIGTATGSSSVGSIGRSNVTGPSTGTALSGMGGAVILPIIRHR